jgi:hypothetical protein
VKWTAKLFRIRRVGPGRLRAFAAASWFTVVHYGSLTTGPHMLLSPLPGFIAVAFIGLTFTQTPSAAEPPAEKIATQNIPPASCRVTRPENGFTPPAPFPSDPESDHPLSWGPPNGSKRFWFGSAKLWTVLPVDGVWRALTFSVEGNYAYFNKLPWFHQAFPKDSGTLTITGKRLDGPAPSFTETEEINAWGRGKSGVEGLMGGISTPVFGCWLVTGRYKDEEISFTVWVVNHTEGEPDSPDSVVSQGSSAQQTAPRRVYVDSEEQAKMLVYRVTPQIPQEAANVSGTVVLHSVIDPSGRPRQVEYVSGPPPLAQAAIDAVKWWQYEVGLEREEIDTMIEVAFPPGDNQ